MNRLTEINKDACDLCNLDCKHTDNSCEKAKLYNKLAHYEDLEEQGRLIELPCKVGDTVWCVTDKYIFVAWVDSFYLTEEDGLLSLEVNLTDAVENDIEIKASSFGHNVFLTEAEAEAKLAELSGDAKWPKEKDVAVTVGITSEQEKLGISNVIALLTVTELAT